MTTQKQIKEWIPTAVEIFQRFMPCPEIPEIHIVREKTLFKKRAEIVERLQAKQKNASPETYDIVMEMIHGDLGNAILIRQNILLPRKEATMPKKNSHTTSGMNLDTSLL